MISRSQRAGHGQSVRGGQRTEARDQRDEELGFRNIEARNSVFELADRR
jgi:hypothetical protein